MDLSNSIKICLTKSFVIKGRASKSEFWWYYLFIIVIGFILLLINEILGMVFFIININSPIMI